MPDERRSPGFTLFGAFDAGTLAGFASATFDVGFVSGFAGFCVAGFVSGCFGCAALGFTSGCFGASTAAGGGLPSGCGVVALYSSKTPQPMSARRMITPATTTAMRPVFGGNFFTFENTPEETFDIVSRNFCAADGLSSSCAYVCSNRSP